MMYLVLKLYREATEYLVENAFTKEARENKLTNASAEGMNNKIKTMTKIAHGYMNFDRFRKRILLIYKY